MRLYGLFDNVPFVAIFAISVVIAWLSFEGGFWMGLRRNQRQDHEQEVVVRSEVGAILGLVTFILALTFWIATFHFDSVRQAKLNEANAIRTTFLRADLLPEPHRTEIQNLLREYVNVRLDAARSGNLEYAISRSEELQRLLWSQAVAATSKVSSPIFGGYFIQSLNEVIALHSRRLTVGVEFRIPSGIWIVLFVIMSLAILAIGCHAGLTRARRPLVVIAFVVIFSTVMTLIADLDSPRRGALKVSQKALVDLQNMMNAPNH
jgi:hypothetical protein